MSAFVVYRADSTQVEHPGNLPAAKLSLLSFHILSIHQAYGFHQLSLRRQLVTSLCLLGFHDPQTSLKCSLRHNSSLPPALPKAKA